MAEIDALFLYVRGLKTQVQAQVMMQNPSTLKDTMRIADSADSAIQFANRMTQRPPNLNPRPNPARLPRPAPPQQPAWLIPMELGAIYIQPQPEQGRWIPLICYRCGQIGHIRQNCPQNAQ